MVRETLQSLRIDALTLLAFTANDNDPLVGDSEASGTSTLTAWRIYEPRIETL
jgi:hypothetical protein